MNNILYLILLILFSGNTVLYNKNSNAPNCLECHNDIILRKTVHPVAQDCETCHQYNAGEHPSKFNKFSVTAKIPELCYNCHDAVQTSIVNSKVIHGAINDTKSCINCHSPHSSDNAKLLKKEGNELCLTCHNKVIETEGHKISNIKQKVTNSKVVHPAIDEGCITCHKPHSSERKNLLAAQFPSDEYTAVSADSFALCFNCHDVALIESATTISATSFRNGNKNLHYFHINGSKGRSCTLCHDIHGSNNEHLIKEKVEFGQFEMSIKYLSTETGGSCKNACHSEKTYQR